MAYNFYRLPGKPELLDLITEMLEHLVYGWNPVYNEAIVFEKNKYFYDLEAGNEEVKDIYDISSVRGTKDGTEKIFEEDIDYQLYDSTGNGKFDSFRWFTSGGLPDEKTIFYVDYRYQVKPTGWTDVSPGSGFRTLVESIAIQLYRTFLKIEEVGRDSYIDTAIGRRLDLLGRLVAVSRNEATRTTGFVTLQRDSSNTTSIIDIPIGTRFATISTSISPSISFQTVKTARIRSGETIAVTYTDDSDPDHLQPWVEVECVEAGIIGNVSSGTISRNVTGPPQITYVSNRSIHDRSGEQFVGDGETQVFELSHSPSSVSRHGIKYLEYKHGYLEQPSSATVVRLELTTGSGGYTGGNSVTCTLYGIDNTDIEASEAVNLDDTASNITTTTQFKRINYITFSNSNDPSEGIGEGIGSGYGITVGKYSTSWDEIFIDDQAVGTRADSGWLDMVADDEKIELYIWKNNSWILVEQGTTGPTSDRYAYTDTGSNAGRIMWDDGLGGGSTWNWVLPYITQYDAGPNADGRNIKIEYYPIPGEEGTGVAIQRESGITAITIDDEYKYGWLNQPSASTLLSFSFTDGAGLDQNWSGTVVVHGRTATGGFNDEEALVFSTEAEKTTIKRFINIDYISWTNADNPSEGPGEGSAASTYARTGTTTRGIDIMAEQQCGIRVDGGKLSLVGVDSDNTLKVYVWDNGWSIRNQASGHYTYSDIGDSAGYIDWSGTWDWTTLPYINKYDAGPFGDGRNIKIEYVPAFDQYSTEGEQLKLEGTPTTNSDLSVSYTWSNQFLNGSNTETDVVFRNRIKTSISALAKGTLDAIRGAVLGITGIEGVTVDDNSTDPTINIGEVHIFAWTGTGLLDAGTRSLVVQAVEDTRAAGVKPIIRSPIPIFLVVQVTIKIDKKSIESVFEVKSGAEYAIASFINSLGINQPMYKTALINAIKEVESIKYIDISTLKVYGYNTETSTDVSQEPPYSSSPYWSFAETADPDHQLWSSNENIIYLNSGYVFRADTDSTGINNKAIEVTVEYA